MHKQSTVRKPAKFDWRETGIAAARPMPEHLIECLRPLQTDFPTVAINLRMTTMQDGERLVLEGVCALAVTIADVPELSPGTIERHHLCDAQMATVCAPSHPLAAIAGPIPREEFGRHIQRHEAGITAFVPKTVTSSATAHGRFSKDDFIYDPQTNEYRCPAGERLIWRFSTVERGLKLSNYWSSNCQQCPLKEEPISSRPNR